MPFGSIEEGIASILVQQRDALQEEVTPVYVPLLGKHFASDEAEPFDLETSVRQFMGVENQRRILVLYGEAGSGKNSFLQTLALSLLAEYMPASPIPLFIHQIPTVFIQNAIICSAF